MKSAKDTTHTEPSSSELMEIPKCTNMTNGDLKNCAILETNVKEIKIIKDSISDEIEHESRDKNIDENHTELEENCQSVNTPFSSDNNECISEEEVYSEVDEDVDSDQYLDVASDDEENEDHVEDSDLKIAYECEKTIDSLIKNVENEKTVSELKVAGVATPTLSSNKCESPEACDDLMSEEEVYEEILEDSDEESVLDKLITKVSEANSGAGGALPNGLIQLTDVDVRVSDDLITNKCEQHKLHLVELDSKQSTESKESFDDKDQITQISEKVDDVHLENKLIVEENQDESTCCTSDEHMNATSKSVPVGSEKSDLNEMASPSSKAEETLFNLTEKANVKEAEKEFSTILENSARVEHMDVSDEVGSLVDDSEQSECNETSPSLNIEGTVIGNVKESEKGISIIPQNNASGEHMNLCDDIRSPVVCTEKSVAYEEKIHSFTTERTLIEEMNVKNTEEASRNHAIDDSMDVSDEVITLVDVTEKSEVNKVTNPSLNVERTVLDTTEKVKVNEKDINDSNDEKMMEERSEGIKEEVRNAVISDELDTCVEDIFVNDEFSSVDAQVEPSKTQSDSEDEIELLIEDFNAANSDDDCLIVEDTSKVIVINDDIKKSKQKDNTLNIVEADTNLVTTNSSDQVPEPKASTSVEVKSNSSKIDTNVKLKDPTVKSLSNADLNSELISGVNKKQKIISNSAETHSSSNEKDSVQTDNQQQDETDEIIIDKLDPLKMASESVSDSTVSSAKILNIEESRKRTFEEMEDDTTDVATKKFKDSFANEIPNDVDPVVQEAVKDQVSKIIPQESSLKFITTKKILDKIAMDVLARSIQDIQPYNYFEQNKYVDDAEAMLAELDEDLRSFNTQVNEIMSIQEETFEKKNFNPQVVTRTVGVNVKIFRECDLPPSMIRVNREQARALAPRPSNPTATVSRPLVTIQQSAPVRRMLAPTIVTNASRPRQVIAGQRFTSSSPNVTIAGNPLATLTNSVTNRPLTPRFVSVPSRIQTPINKSTIDLTGEGALIKRTIASSIASIPTTTVSNLSGQQNVLVPIGNFLQMLPNNKGIAQLTTGSQIQATRLPVTQPARQTILQPVRQGLLPPAFRPNLGSRTVAYFMPSNSNQLPNFGGRGGITLPPFLSGSNPRGVQTIVVRMTTAAPPAPLSSIVNSSSRMSAPSQPTLNTTTATTTTSHGLVLFPRAAKHPAPYPQNPVYPPNPKFKMIPPQPSLKGSRAPEQGIILSWNMNMQTAHSDVANYQLYAYQETSGLVTSSLWKKVGDVKALPLPMACTLTQFIEGHRYYFGVRAVDVHGRCGLFSEPVDIFYGKQDAGPATKK